MKTVSLTVRRCPAGLHQTLKKSAKANRRSVNAETLVWLENQAERSGTITGAEWAKNLRKAQAMLTPADREQIAQGIQEARKKAGQQTLDPGALIQYILGRYCFALAPADAPKPKKQSVPDRTINYYHGLQRS